MFEGKGEPGLMDSEAIEETHNTTKNHMNLLILEDLCPSQVILL